MSVQTLDKPTMRTAISRKKRRERRALIASKDGSAFRLTTTAAVALTILSLHVPICLEYWPLALIILACCFAANLRRLNRKITNNVNFPLFWKAPSHSQLFYARVQHGFFRNGPVKKYARFPYLRKSLRFESVDNEFVWDISDTPGCRPIAEDADGFRPVEFTFKRVS
jgi:hypothetical protein